MLAYLRIVLGVNSKRLAGVARQERRLDFSRRVLVWDECRILMSLQNREAVNRGISNQRFVALGGRQASNLQLRSWFWIKGPAQ